MRNESSIRRHSDKLNHMSSSCNADTVNVAARIESTSESNRIQISQETADLLEEAGKPHWFSKRAEPVHAKGMNAGVVVFALASHDHTCAH